MWWRIVEVIRGLHELRIEGRVPSAMGIFHQRPQKRGCVFFKVLCCYDVRHSRESATIPCPRFLENPLWARSERGCTALSKKSSSPSFKANLRKRRSASRKLMIYIERFA